MRNYPDLNSALDAMPRFLEFESSLKPRHSRATPLRATADPNKPNVYFEKNGKLCYKSDCPNYGGYWLDGLSGAVVCNQVDFLLPGIILELYCRYHCDECPLHADSDNEERT